MHLCMRLRVEVEATSIESVYTYTKVYTETNMMNLTFVHIHTIPNMCAYISHVLHIVHPW